MIYHAGVRAESTDRWADGEGNNYGSGGGLTDAELNDILRRHLFAKIIPFFNGPNSCYREAGKSD